jgi:hypothetical protein
VAWVWIAGRPLGSKPISNAWTALRHPLLFALILPEPRCEAVLLYFSPRVSCFLFPCKLDAFHFVSCRMPLCDFLRLSVTAALCKLKAVNNLDFLSKSRFRPIKTGSKKCEATVISPGNVPSERFLAQRICVQARITALWKLMKFRSSRIR